MCVQGDLPLTVSRLGSCRLSVTLPPACGSLYLFRGIPLSAGQSVDSCCLNSLACSVNEKCAMPEKQAGGKTDILWENDKNKHPFRLQF